MGRDGRDMGPDCTWVWARFSLLPSFWRVDLSGGIDRMPVVFGAGCHVVISDGGYLIISDRRRCAKMGFLRRQSPLQKKVGHAFTPMTMPHVFFRMIIHGMACLLFCFSYPPHPYQCHHNLAQWLKSSRQMNGRAVKFGFWIWDCGLWTVDDCPRVSPLTRAPQAIPPTS
jgi:hypothetical protein